jgi:imidazolonepropionase-like amidohydrolase
MTSGGESNRIPIVERRPLMNSRKSFLLPVLLFAALGCSLPAQENAADRRASLDPATPTTDDPRRIPVPPGPRGPEGTIVLRGGRIFDGTGAAARFGTVVIRRNVIDKILPAGSSDWPKDAVVIDVAGKTVMPGLIDAHTHISYSGPETSPYLDSDEADAMLRAVERARYYIESGITSIRDVGSHGNVPFRLKAWVSENRVAAPRIFPAGVFITATGGHAADSSGLNYPVSSSARVAEGPDQWRQAVREQFNRGADLIKIGSHFSPAEVKAACEEAHALGLKVGCDAETFYIQWAVEAGVDVIEHPLPRTDETIRLMALKGTQSVPTIVPYIYIFDQLGGYFGSTSRRFSFSKAANLDVLGRMKRAGIRMGIGTDLVSDWFRYLPIAYITELESFVEAGFSVTEALVAATRTNAEILDMDDKLGTLEPGKLADVVVIDGRPDEKLADLANVDIVIRDGYLLVRGGSVVIRRHVPVVPPVKKQG